MDKTLQTKAWNCLPKEFKEEVKKEWELTDNIERLPHDAFLRGKCQMMRDLFGHHNLTSDAEGEEMLCVPRKKMQEMYAANERIKTDFPDKETGIISDHINHILGHLFGSKCLPDEEPKPAELKYRSGEKVCYNGYVYEIEGLVGKNRYALKGLNFDLDEDMIEPYIKPEENIAGNRNLSQDCDKEFDNILKNSFSKERRLNVAAMAMQGILSNESRMKRYEDIAASEPYEKMTDLVTRNALRYADALINKATE